MPTLQKDFIVRNGLVVNTNLIFATGGQVGINNSNPTANLDVTGNTNISGSLNVAANVVVSGILTYNTDPYIGPTKNVFINQTNGNVAANGSISANGGFKGYSGTAGVPTYSYIADTNSGHYSSNADEVSLALGGVQVWIYGAAGTTTSLPMLTNGLLTANAGAYINVNANVSGNLNVTGTSNLSFLNLSANVGMGNNYIVAPRLKSWKEHVQTVVNANGVVNLDMANTNVFWLQLAANTTLTYQNVPPSGTMYSATFYVQRLAPGGQSLTFPAANTKYAGGSPPPHTTTSGSIDIWTVSTLDGGVNCVTSLSMKDVR